MKKTIVEASVYKESLQKIKELLITKQGLSKIEANYVIGFYDAIRNLNLFSSNYFKNFEYEGELFDLNNIQKFVKFPETFYDVVMLVMHNSALLENFQINFDGINVKLAKKEIIKKEEKKEEKATVFDAFKVAEDLNYYTFHIPNAKIAKRFRTFYAEVYPNDQDIKNFSNFFFPTWCVLSSSAEHHFTNQKHQNSDIWLVTFLKQNPAEKLRNEYGVSSLSNNEKVSESLSYGDEFSKQKNQLGEIYLMKNDGTTGNGSNYGYHAYTNSPHSGSSKSFLNTKPIYSYGSIDILKKQSISEAFEIKNGKLINCNINNDVIKVPEGVIEIEKGAFKNLSNVKKIVMPISLIKINNDAFEQLPNLRAIQLRNNIEVIEANAFDKLNSNSFNNTFYLSQNQLKDLTWRDVSSGPQFFMIGVIEESKDATEKEREERPSSYYMDYIIKKPSKLRYMPREIVNVYKYLQKSFGVKSTDELKENKIIKETFQIKRPKYEMADLYSVEPGNKMIIDADEEDAKTIKSFEIPEGIEVLKGSFKKFLKLENISFPSTLKEIKIEFFSDVPLINLDLSKTKIKEITHGQFSNMIYLEKVILPDTIKIINPYAFSGSTLESIYIKNGVDVLFNAFKNCPFLEIVYTDDPIDFKINVPYAINFPKNIVVLKQK